jgi:diguanylate cyclase (GGDEF)-like protein
MATARTRSRDLEASNERLRVLASIDELTGLYNARYFNIALGDQWQWSREKEKSLALLLIDLDFFKQVNDRHSHLTGNEVLAAISGRILHSIRQSTDLAARFGGEEFAVILPGANVVQAAKIAENLRANIAKSPIKTETLKNETVPMTASVGVVATMADANDSIPDTESFIHQADEALYQAKQDGRNCVRISKSSLRPPGEEGEPSFVEWGSKRPQMEELQEAEKP